MLTTRLILRVLDADGTLLAWTETLADARGDGQLWASQSVAVAIERAGTPAVVSIHWADVNVEVRSAITHRAVTPGEVMALYLSGQPVMRIGAMPEALPPVTVRGPTAIGVPVGSTGVRV